jgi:hypothetical protein
MRCHRRARSPTLFSRLHDQSLHLAPPSHRASLSSLPTPRRVADVGADPRYFAMHFQFNREFIDPNAAVRSPISMSSDSRSVRGHRASLAHRNYCVINGQP